MRRRYDESIEDILGPSAVDADFDPEDLTPKYRPYDEDFDFGIKGEDDQPLDKVTPETGDGYLNAEIARGRVVRRKRDADGNLTGRASSNLVLDTRTYEVEFDDGDVTKFTANMIAQAMYSQCDTDGNQYLLLDQLVDHQKDDTAITLTKQTVHRDNGRTYRRKTTAGWQICCQWIDGSTTWEKLSDLKESHPIETAEYAVTHGIDHEPAFNWWVKHFLKKRERIISLVKRHNTRYLKRTHNFSIELPKTVQEALALDKKNGNTL